MVWILAGIVSGIVNHIAVLIVRLGKWAALDEEWQIGFLAIAVLERTECLYTCRINV